MEFPIALQLYSVRGEAEQDFAGAIRRVKELGNDGVEFAGLYGKSAEEAADIVKSAGLQPISAHVPFDDMVADPQRVLSDYAKIGCRYVAIPYLTQEYHPGKPGFQTVMKQAVRLGEIAASLGMQLLYHNHDFEFQKVDGEYALDMLYRAVPADLLATELDTCWVNVGGENPADYIRKYAGRAPVVHLKDFVMPGKKPERLYSLIGIKDEEDARESSAFEFRPIGQGVQDIPAIVEASREAGAVWLVVEQDEPSAGKTPMQCAKESIKYLRSL